MQCNLFDGGYWECGNEICTKKPGNLPMKDSFFTKRNMRLDCLIETQGRTMEQLNTAVLKVLSAK